MPPGGKREPGPGKKLGRPKTKPEVLGDGDKQFSSRVLARVGKKGWLDYVDIAKVQSDEDLALHYLAGNHSQDQFNKLLDRKYGRPVTRVAVGNADGERFGIDITTAHDRLIAKLMGGEIPPAVDK